MGQSKWLFQKVWFSVFVSLSLEEEEGESRFVTQAFYLRKGKAFVSFSLACGCGRSYYVHMGSTNWTSELFFQKEEYTEAGGKTREGGGS